MGDEYGPWVPLDPVEVRHLLRDYPHPWWIAGGWAIDMFLGRKTRHHEDIDVGFFLTDALDVQRTFLGWDLQLALSGTFRHWDDGYELTPDEDNVWARPTPESAWAVQFMFNPGGGSTWVYHRVPTITRPLDEVILRTGDGIPFLAPEVQLLYKAGSRGGVRPKDQADFDTVLPHLDATRRRWLRNALPSEHAWRAPL